MQISRRLFQEISFCNVLILWWFLNIYISQGSVTTQLRCGDIFYNYLIANCPQTVPMKKFWKSVNIGEDVDNDKMWQFFRDTVYIEMKKTANKHAKRAQQKLRR